MADEEKPVQAETQEPQGERVTDWKAEARKWEARAKENSAAAKKLQELEEANKSEFQKMLERAEQAESRVKALEEATKTQELKSALAKEYGVPSELLPNLAEEELRVFAKNLSEYVKPGAAPKVPKNGKFTADGADTDPRRELARQVFGTQESE